MTKRSYVRIISFSLAIVLTLGSLALINMTTATSYKAQLENSYQQSLNELSENLDSIETNLKKSIYSSSDKMLLEISSDLYAECSEAKEALSRLPVSQMNLGSTYKFISQASDYANFIAQKIASGEKISDEEHKNLCTLMNYSEKLNDSVSAMATVANNGGVITNSNLKASEIEVKTLSTNMSTAEDAFKDYPTLLYDGPFADAVLNREAALIKDKDTFSKNEAQDIAANAIGVSSKEISFESEEKGSIPCYVFTYGQRTIGVTKKGGYIAYILYSGKITKSTINEDNAVNLAKNYLSGLGYENMTPSYHMTADNICIINFAYKTGNTIYYSDLIKVGVAMSNGKIVSLEAEGYITNHLNRSDFKPSVSEGKAKQLVSSYLTVIDSKQCVIPKNNGTEKKCIELHCESKDTNEEVLVYLNADTGVEEDIMLLLYSDGGTLTK
ncbi:MAG: germination protein YpeB [Acetobacter sp.]|nr:germination protein YpeB [Bacteroides sp.]MCM1340291.1 germination protein YpeB [Acetobacter sp.]MCM1432759.1 germination protein YpeB [Clostridiales bacterium]